MGDRETVRDQSRGQTMWMLATKFSDQRTTQMGLFWMDTGSTDEFTCCISRTPLPLYLSISLITVQNQPISIYLWAIYGHHIAIIKFLRVFLNIILPKRRFCSQKVAFQQRTRRGSCYKSSVDTFVDIAELWRTSLCLSLTLLISDLCIWWPICSHFSIQ